MSAHARGRDSPLIVECGPIDHAPHSTAAPNGGDTVLGQGTTFGEGQTMTLMITTGQSMQTPLLHSTPAAKPYRHPGGLRLFHQRAERERHRQLRHGRNQHQLPHNYGVSVPSSSVSGRLTVMTSSR
jgi:hypothetical protein